MQTMVLGLGACPGIARGGGGAKYFNHKSTLCRQYTVKREELRGSGGMLPLKKLKTE